MRDIPFMKTPLINNCSRDTLPRIIGRFVASLQILVMTLVFMTISPGSVVASSVSDAGDEFHASLSASLDWDQQLIKQEYSQLRLELFSTFRDWLLEFPPLSSAEIAGMRADFVEHNIDLFVKQQWLGDRLNAMEQGITSEIDVVEEARRIRNRKLLKIIELRANPSGGNSTPTQDE